MILIQVLIILGVTLTVLYIFSDIMKPNQREQFRIQTIISVDMVRSNLTAYLKDTTAWNATLADASNVGMDCLRNNTICSAGSAIINIKNTAGASYYNLSSGTAGFKLSGETCNTFDAINGNFECPLRVIINWIPNCTVPCHPTRISVNGDFLLKTEKSQMQVNINLSKFGFQLFKSVP